jgi:hypothetical protein
MVNARDTEKRSIQMRNSQKVERSNKSYVCYGFPKFLSLQVPDELPVKIEANCVVKEQGPSVTSDKKHNRQSGKRLLSFLIGRPGVVLLRPYAKEIQVEHKEWKDGK